MNNKVIARYPATETPWIMIQLNLLRLFAWIRCSININKLIRALSIEVQVAPTVMTSLQYRIELGRTMLHFGTRLPQR